MRLVCNDIKLSDDNLSYPLYQISDNPAKILFVDIETTGFSPKSSTLYLIGCAYFDGHMYHSRQWFSESNDDETSILSSFIEFSKVFDTLVHFNGNKFDLPYLSERCKAHNIDYTLDNFDSVDLYKKIRPYQKALGLINCKQKTIETFLGINRDDKYSGGELIEIYKQYIESPKDTAFDTLMLHNFDDIKGLIKILPILWYSDFFDDIENCPAIHMRTDVAQSESSIPLPLKATKAYANYYKDIDGNDKSELIIKASLYFALPKPLTLMKDDFACTIEGASATFKMPILDDELKYFYSNYKDYYYLPDEDQALHKSVASFVDRSHRVKCTAENCYTRKPGQFLRQFDFVFTPFFKKNYKDKAIYFELSDHLKQSRTALSLYACHILNSMMF